MLRMYAATSGCAAAVACLFSATPDAVLPAYLCLPVSAVQALLTVPAPMALTVLTALTAQNHPVAAQVITAVFIIGVTVANITCIVLNSSTHTCLPLPAKIAVQSIL